MMEERPGAGAGDDTTAPAGHPRIWWDGRDFRYVVPAGQRRPGFYRGETAADCAAIEDDESVVELTVAPAHRPWTTTSSEIAHLFTETYERLGPQMVRLWPRDEVVTWELMPQDRRDHLVATIAEVRAKLLNAAPAVPAPPDVDELIRERDEALEAKDRYLDDLQDAVEELRRVRMARAVPAPPEQDDEHDGVLLWMTGSYDVAMDNTSSAIPARISIGDIDLDVAGAVALRDALDAAVHAARGDKA